MSINLEKYEVGCCIALAIATIGSVGLSVVTSSAVTNEPSSCVETIASTTVRDITPPSTTRTTETTSTTTSTTVGTKVIEIITDDHMIETVIIPDNEMIAWSQQTTITTATMTNPTMPATYIEYTTETTVTSDVINPISDADYILLCNCVAQEAGATYIPASEKAKVVEVIMNRVNSSSYPDTIYGVITQRGQFTGASNYANLGCYSNQVDDLVKQGVDEYFANIENYQHGYLSFHGDGRQNYFK